MCKICTYHFALFKFLETTDRKTVSAIVAIQGIDEAIVAEAQVVSVARRSRPKVAVPADTYQTSIEAVARTRSRIPDSLI